jgi:membrane-associated phospholipid phosphatase
VPSSGSATGSPSPEGSSGAPATGSSRHDTSARGRAARSLTLLLAALPLAAAGEGPRPIRHDLRVDGAVTAAAFALWIGAAAARPYLAPTRCRICGAGRLDVAARDALRWDDVGLARDASDVLAVGLVPAGVALHQLLAARAAGDAGEGLVDLLVVAQAVAIAGDLNQAVKYATARARPYVRDAAGRRGDPDDHLSFYSSHTSVAFSLAASAGTVSSLRGYRSAPWVWAAGLGLAATTGYLRIAGDQHHLTDVLAGAAAGTAIGVALPRLLHGRERPAGVAAGPVAGPLSLGITLAF